MNFNYLAILGLFTEMANNQALIGKRSKARDVGFERPVSLIFFCETNFIETRADWSKLESFCCLCSHLTGNIKIFVVT